MLQKSYITISLLIIVTAYPSCQVPPTGSVTRANILLQCYSVTRASLPLPKPPVTATLHKGNSQIRKISHVNTKVPLTPTTTHPPTLLYMRRSSTGGVVPNIYQQPTFSSKRLCARLGRVHVPVAGGDLQWTTQVMATQGNSSKTCSSTQPVCPSQPPSRFLGVNEAGVHRTGRLMT